MLFKEDENKKANCHLAVEGFAFAGMRIKEHLQQQMNPGDLFQNNYFTTKQNLKINYSTFVSKEDKNKKANCHLAVEGFALAGVGIKEHLQ